MHVILQLFFFLGGGFGRTFRFLGHGISFAGMGLHYMEPVWRKALLPPSIFGLFADFSGWIVPPGMSKQLSSNQPLCFAI
jgi:hypothetical protein